jgi:hypothetical protein
MRTTALFAGLVLLAALRPAIAADGKKPAEVEPGTSVEMPYLIAPLAAGDTLVAYAYVTSTIIASSPSSAIDIRDKIAFIQDKFVRDVNASSIGKPDDPKAVDEAKLTARLLADVKTVMKPGTVAGLKVVEVQIRPMRPDATPPGG